MKRANVFICHNPFHFYISKQICKDKFTTNQFDNIIVSPFKTNQLDGTVNYIVVNNSLFGKLRSLWIIKRTIKRMMIIYKDNLYVFLPHIDGIIGNYIFESHAMRSIKINFYYEGIVMLDENRMDRKFPRFLISKILLSFSIFHKFVVQADILPMNSSRINKIYTPYPEKTPAPESKKVNISFQRENMNSKTSGVLIVGVDAGEQLEVSYKELINFIKLDKRNENCFFKAHYADRMKVFENLARENKFNYKLIQDVRCIEEIIADLDVDMIICTHLSSALLNLKLIYKGDLRVVFFAHSKAIDVLGDDNVLLANSLGIEILNFDRV